MVAEAIDDLRKAGGILTIATGRTPFLTGIYTKELGITSPIITSNGASIYDPVGRTEIEINPIDEGITLTFLDYFTKKGCDATGYSPEAVYQMVEDEHELDYLLNIFSELVEDVDFEF